LTTTTTKKTPWSEKEDGSGLGLVHRAGARASCISSPLSPSLSLARAFLFTFVFLSLGLVLLTDFPNARSFLYLRLGDDNNKNNRLNGAKR